MELTAQIQEVASCLNVMRPDPMRVEAWIGAMKSGAYRFGYGVLRSGADEYDAFGVLAALSCPAWTWDDTEGAWAIDGDCYYLKPDLVVDWLGVGDNPDLRSAGMPHWIEKFARVVTIASDGAKSFDDVVALLRAGVERADYERDRLKSLRTRDLRDMGLGDYDRIQDKMPYFSYGRGS